MTAASSGLSIDADAGHSQPRRTPITFIGVHDRSPELRLLYVSSSVRQGLHLEPQDMLWKPSFNYLEGNNVSEYKRLNMLSGESSVVTSGVVVRSGTGELRTVRVIQFTSDDIVCNIATIYPDPAPEPTGHMAVGVQPCAPVRVQPTCYARSCTKACLVLVHPADSDSSSGPRVLFASRSFAHILDVDPCDLQGLPFLSLVAAADTVAAARFLEKMAAPERIVLDQLRFRVDPSAATDNDDNDNDNNDSGSDGRPRGERTAMLEVLGAGSDDGAIILCQLHQPRGAARDNSDGYMSMAELISSDPETSDCAEAWTAVC
ncbi:hypothetical protein H4R18_001523 [Coemansia javaensis]|uniref:PAS domain-containing protein n=1 Tax=Coemansia javaensis TaxID=2761396 RepID=A0A9W8HCM4_9FUNG|nr:hypothetical protein H4R18_001523 [Coemansia javaensis]